MVLEQRCITYYNEIMRDPMGFWASKWYLLILLKSRCSVQCFKSAQDTTEGSFLTARSFLGSARDKVACQETVSVSTRGAIYKWQGKNSWPQSAGLVKTSRLPSLHFENPVVENKLYDPLLCAHSSMNETAYAIPCCDCFPHADCDILQDKGCIFFMCLASNLWGGLN